MVSAYRPVARLRSNTKISLSVLIEVSPNAYQGHGHLSPRWSQPALSLRHKVTVGGRQEPRPTSTGVEPPILSPPSSGSLAGTQRADPTLVITCVMYVVYKYIPVITAQVITAR